MNIRFLNKVFWIVSILLVSVLFSSCRNCRSRESGGGGGGGNNRVRNVAQTVNIINTTNNTTHYQPQFNSVSVQNIDNSRRENLSRTFNNLTNNTNNTTNVSVNNTQTNLSYNSSISNNYISQHILQQIYNRTTNNNTGIIFREGDIVEINNLNINGTTINGIIATVNNNYRTGITICENTYRQIIQQINYIPDDNPRVGRGTGNDDRPATPAGRPGRPTRPGSDRNPPPNSPSYQPPPNYDSPNQGNNPFAGTDPGGVNFLTIIGAIVVILFFLWILSWFM